jgi:hypothetical protein
MEKRASIFLVVLPIFVAIAWALPMVLSESYILRASFTTIVLCLALYTTHKLFDFMPISILKIKNWQNKEQKANFNVSNVSQSVFCDRLFCIFVSCPKNAFLHAKTNFALTYVLEDKIQKYIHIPSPIKELSGNKIPAASMKASFKNSLFWRSNKNETIKIQKLSSEIIDLFELNNDGTFSIVPQENNQKFFLLWNKFGIGEHTFGVKITAKDFRKKLLVQELSMKIDFDGQLIKTINLVEL